MANDKNRGLFKREELELYFLKYQEEHGDGFLQYVSTEKESADRWMANVPKSGQVLYRPRIRSRNDDYPQGVWIARPRVGPATNELGEVSP